MGQRNVEDQLKNKYRTCGVRINGMPKTISELREIVTTVGKKQHNIFLFEDILKVFDRLKEAESAFERIIFLVPHSDFSAQVAKKALEDIRRQL